MNEITVHPIIIEKFNDKLWIINNKTKIQQIYNPSVTDKEILKLAKKF